MTPQNKRILVAPLNWGLGHATRCIPVINALRAQGAVPVLAAPPALRAVVQAECPDIEILPEKSLDNWHINYPKNGNMMGAMLLQLPKIYKTIAHEHEQLKNLIIAHDIHGVISDNRYGLHTALVPCVLLTHQLSPQSPEYLWGFGENLLQKIIENYAKKFNSTWLPDQPTAPLAGKLIQNTHLKNTRFIGTLSRFDARFDGDIQNIYNKNIDVLVVLSGLEPQRTLLENLILNQANYLPNKKITVVRGLPTAPATITQNIPKNTEIYDYLPQNALQNLIFCSKLVVCRSGYSTIMDLAAAAAKAAFVPTPGQTEQIYLAKNLEKRGIAPYQNQNNFDLKKMIDKAQNYSGFVAQVNDASLLHGAVAELLGF